MMIHFFLNNKIEKTTYKKYLDIKFSPSVQKELVNNVFSHIRHFQNKLDKCYLQIGDKNKACNDWFKGKRLGDKRGLERW